MPKCRELPEHRMPDGEALLVQEFLDPAQDFGFRMELPHAML